MITLNADELDRLYAQISEIPLKWSLPLHNFFAAKVAEANAAQAEPEVQDGTR